MSQTSTLEDAKKRILSRVALDQLIQEVVALTRKGNRLTGLCPFHAEKSPSFYVFDDHYHCFGCHAHGDAISFVRQTKELSFVETLRFLAGKYGVEAPELEQSAKYQARKNENTALSRIMVTAQEFYVEELKGEAGASAREYLRSRGFSDENITAYGFGLTPNEHFGLVRHLRSMRFRDEDILKVGLGAVSNKTGNLYDFFRERIMIPIRDASGRVIAFGGRTTSDDPAKYKNSMGTPLFDKGSVLFGLDKSKDQIKQRGRAVIVEGYMDTLCLWQEGFGETVACMGTALNLRHLKLLQSQSKCQDVVLLFDGDNAGRNATLESIELALASPGLRVRAAMIPEGDDPDTFVRTKGSDALRQLIDAAQDLIDVAINARLKNATTASIPTIVNESFIPWLSRVQDPVKRSYLINMVSSKSGVSADVLSRQVRSLLHGVPEGGRLQPPPANQLAKLSEAQEDAVMMLPTRPLKPVEESFLGHLYHGHPGEIDVSLASNFLLREIHLEPLWESFAKSLLLLHTEKKAPRDSTDSLASLFTSEELKVLSRITESKTETFTSPNRMASLQALSREQKRQSIQQAISSMKQEVLLAGQRSPELVPELLTQIMTLNKTLATLQAGG